MNGLSLLSDLRGRLAGLSRRRWLMAVIVGWLVLRADGPGLWPQPPVDPPRVIHARPAPCDEKPAPEQAQAPGIRAKLVVKWDLGCAPDDGPKVAGCADVHLYVVAPVGSQVTLNLVEVAEYAGHQSESWTAFQTYTYEDPGTAPPCAPVFGQGEVLFDCCYELWATDAHHNGLWAVAAVYSVEVDAMHVYENLIEAIDIELDNLILMVAEDDPHPPLLKWLEDGSPDNKTEIAFTLHSANTIPVTPTIRLYPLVRSGATQPVRTHVMSPVTSPTPAPVTWVWDGKDDGGQFVNPGPYAFAIEAAWEFGACPAAFDWKTSRYLSLYLPQDLAGEPDTEVEYLGYANGKQQFKVKYLLTDPQNTSASEGRIEVYRPDLTGIYNGQLAAADRTADLEGTLHEVTVEIDNSAMTQAGTYYFAVFARDDHGDQEKGHRTKPALEVGQELDVLVKSVTWQTLGDNTPLDQNPGNDPQGQDNGTAIGLRIFPGKQTPTDPVPELRRQVGVVAEIAPPLEHFPLKFCSYDVDDPSSNTAPVDLEQTQWPQTENDDNRSQPGFPKRGKFVDSGAQTTEAETDNVGMATTVFEVTLQPGDNFRVVATGKDNDLAAVAPKPDDRDAQNDPQARVFLREMEGGQVVGEGEPVLDDETTLAVVKATPVLTVWRKLHVEVDSMGQPVGTSISGTLAVGDITDNQNGTFTVTIHQQLDDSVDRFVPGQLSNEGTVFDVAASTAGNPFTLTVNSVGGNGPVPGDFTLVDDDVVPADVPDPVTTVMAEKLLPCYTQALLANEWGEPGCHDPSAPFALNLASYDQTGDPSLETQAQLSRDVSSTPEFWTTHCLGCFQGIQPRDHDPDSDSENCTLGISNGKTAFVFSEHQREYGYGDNPSGKAHALVHEVGHNFGLDDEYSWNPPPYPGNPNYNGIMYWVWKGVFTDGNVSDIRSISCPSGKFFSQY